MTCIEPIELGPGGDCDADEDDTDSGGDDGDEDEDDDEEEEDEDDAGNDDDDGLWDDNDDEYEDDDYGVGWSHLKSVHCNSHYLPDIYSTISEAIEACEDLEDACSGVYDNKCDQEAVQYGSCCAGFVLCDAGYSLEV